MRISHGTCEIPVAAEWSNILVKHGDTFVETLKKSERQVDGIDPY